MSSTVQIQEAVAPELQPAVKAILDTLRTEVSAGEVATTARLIRYGQLSQEYIDARISAVAAYKEGKQIEFTAELRGKEYVHAVKAIEYVLLPVLDRKPEPYRWLQFFWLAKQFAKAAQLSQATLKILSVKAKKADKGYSVPEEWSEFVSQLIDVALEDSLPAQEVGKLLEDEEQLRQQAALAKLTPKEQKERKRTEKLTKAKRQEAKKAAFVKRVVNQASQLGVDLQAELTDELDENPSPSASPSPNGHADYSPVFVDPVTARKAAQLVQWTEAAAVALIEGALASNHDNRPALAALLERLVAYVQAEQSQAVETVSAAA